MTTFIGYSKDIMRMIEDWCFKHDADCWEGSPFVEGFVITAKNPKDVDKANKLNQIYSIFESETRYC